ncbi:MAG TPA: FKBP-type peptidyl-prolyl cis-trans isomerase [Gammaproteobacteria bacterium]|nr:FKBP-type peptidyl-prolyl cis-trans isomerase [Gammaproteobacteria bacterium]
MRLVFPSTALLCLSLLSGCGPSAESPEPVVSGEQVEAPAELTIIELEPGDGPTIALGTTAVVHYTGWLFDPAAEDNKGEKFDSSRDRGQPFRFPLGAGRVIPGWEQGVVGMQVGEQRRLIIPPALGYGQRGAGNVIPPNSTLVFDVELVDIE